MLLICPASPGSRSGNRATVLRWAARLRALGHRVRIAEQYVGGSYDLLIALHAQKSASAVCRWFETHPDRPIVVALTGTDIYPDVPRGAAQQALLLAWRIVILQPLAIERIPESCRAKARVIYQSATRTGDGFPPDPHFFDICVLGHLREEKDPFRAAAAARLLPAASRIRILQAGRALAPEFEESARREQIGNPRYRWLGELSRREARQLLASSRTLALTSRLEGGANVISEAVVNGVPVLASRIDGSVGLLGSDYPGLYDAGDTAALANLMSRAEQEPVFYRQLQQHCEMVAPLMTPEREAASWRELLDSWLA